VKLPALQHGSVAELKTGLERQGPRADHQNVVFPPKTSIFRPRLGPGNSLEPVMAALTASPPRRCPVAGGMWQGPATEPSAGGRCRVALPAPTGPSAPGRRGRASRGAPPRGSSQGGGRSARPPRQLSRSLCEEGQAGTRCPAAARSSCRRTPRHRQGRRSSRGAGGPRQAQLRAFSPRRGRWLGARRGARVDPRRPPPGEHPHPRRSTPYGDHLGWVKPPNPRPQAQNPHPSGRAHAAGPRCSRRDGGKVTRVLEHAQEPRDPPAPPSSPSRRVGRAGWGGGVPSVPARGAGPPPLPQSAASPRHGQARSGPPAKHKPRRERQRRRLLRPDVPRGHVRSHKHARHPPPLN